MTLGALLVSGVMLAAAASAQDHQPATPDAAGPVSGATPKPSAPPSALPQENVTVTSTRSRELLDKFAKSFSVPTPLTGKIARWESGVCPLAIGQKPGVATMMTARIKEIATIVGAPVNANPSCTPNIEVIFTTTPQALLDDVRKNDPDYLGYADNSSRQQALATVTRPVQAWYETETIDLDGMARIDSARRLGAGITMPNFTAFSMPSSMGVNRQPLDLPYATYARVTGNHINDGTRSAFHHVIIAVDSSKLAGQKLGPLADYITMLALTQLNSLDTCQQLPSIVNLLAPGCEQKSDEITQIDLAYLRGLYKMGNDQSLLFQRNDITDQMKQSLGQ
jgi:hypothetical protein